MQGARQFQLFVLRQQGGALSVIAFFADFVEDGVEFFVCVIDGFAQRFGHFLVPFNLSGDLEKIMACIPEDVLSERNRTKGCRRDIAVDEGEFVRIVCLVRMQQGSFLSGRQLAEPPLYTFLVDIQEITITRPKRIRKRSMRRIDQKVVAIGVSLVGSGFGSISIFL